jgi:hypothetical protein
MMTKSLFTITSLFLYLCSYGQYCTTVGPSQTGDSNTESVILNGVSGGISYTGCPGVVGLEDLTATQQVVLSANNSYNILCQFGTCSGSFSSHGEAWIDFNGNEIFEPNESILQWQDAQPMTAPQSFSFNVPAGAINGPTRLRVTQQEQASSFPLDPCGAFSWGSTADFTVIIQAGTGCFTVNSFPYNEGFETSFGAWAQDAQDSIDWTRLSGGTASAGTGPTSAVQGAFYTYIEASAPNYPNKVANLLSPCFDLTALADPQLSFKYHMFGADMGRLNLEVSVNGSPWTLIWTKSGDQTDTWHSEILSLNAYTNATSVQLRFNGITGLDFTSDIAIDAIGINCAGSPGDNKFDAIPISSYPYVDTNNTLICYNNFSLVYNSSDVFYLAVLDTLKDSLRVSLCGSSFDTHLSIQNMAGDVIFYNDDFTGCGSQSEVLFPTAGLDSIYIVVEGWDNEAGEYILNIDNDYVTPNVAVHYINGQEYNLIIYPNPTNSILNIDGVTPEQIYLYNMEGRLVMPVISNANSLDISNLPTGVYILDMIVDEQHLREKIIKQ